MVVTEIIDFIRTLYPQREKIALHEPVFRGNEKRYVNDAIDSTFVSSVGKYVRQFEEMVAEYTGARFAVATNSGTAALHISLELAGVESGSEVITQPLTFVATANAISYCGASPVFVDIDRETLGLSPQKLEAFLKEQTYLDENGVCIDRITARAIKACVPMHTFGLPCRIDEIVDICDTYNIAVIEDAAEALGTLYKKRHAGTFGKAGIFSFNGNKIITAGTGGMIVTDDEDFARRANHLTTTAKLPHPYEYVHDKIGYNYRLNNLSAALGVAQMENLDDHLSAKRELARKYAEFFSKKEIAFVHEPSAGRSNYWLNAVVFDNPEQRDLFLRLSNEQGILTRPAWRLLHRLEIYQNARRGDLTEAERLAPRIVNLPSSVPL